MSTLNETVLKMTLNAENRDRFKAVILKDAFFARSEALRQEHRDIVDLAGELTWGSTGQKRAANKKFAEDFNARLKKAKDKGSMRSGVSGVGVRTFNNFTLIVGGQAHYLVADFGKHTKGKNVIEVDDLHVGAATRTDVLFASDELNVAADSPLGKRFFALIDEITALQEAAEELTAILNTVFGKSKTLGAAIEKWEGLEHYVPMILSSCRELVVAGPVIDARLAALREAEMPVKKAMNIGRE